MLKLCNNIMSQPLYKYLVMTKNSKNIKIGFGRFKQSESRQSSNLENQE